MKRLEYSISIIQPRDIVFQKLTDRHIYPQWTKPWGEDMTYEGEWRKGGHVSFIDAKQGGTKVVIEAFVLNEMIKAHHIAMVNAQNVEVPLTDDMMRKWIGTEESYYLTAESESRTTLQVVVVTDEAFEEMMGAWPKALELFKGLCEA